MENKINFDMGNLEKNVNPIVLGENRFISALFANPKTAEKIYDELLAQGYKPEDINLVMSEETHNTHFPTNNDHTTASELGNKALEGLGVGAAIGASVGALAAAIAAIGTSLVIPGLGLIIAGSLAASFAGAGAGAAAGGLIGALVGSESPNEQAKLFENGLKNGGVVIAIKVNSDQELEKLYSQWLDLQMKDSVNRAA